MKAFTDNDLKSMKIRLDNIADDSISALIARLEAAERCATLWVQYLPDNHDSIYAKEWLASKGEGGGNE